MEPPYCRTMPGAAQAGSASGAIHESGVSPVALPPGTGRRGSETGHAVGLATAAMVANLVGVVFTVVFTRVLGTDGYGSLAALINGTIILFVPGSALQVATARAGALGRLGTGGELAGTLDRWTRRLLLLLLVVALLSAATQVPLAALLDIDETWAAAAVPPTGVLWLLLCVQRGLLQSTRAYRAVGASVILEALGRLAMGAALVGAGLGVTGAYVGTGASLVITALVLAALLRRRLGAPERERPHHRLRALARQGAIPVAALTLVAALQNVDVIMAKHALDEDSAGIYAAATVAGKAVVWIAIGLGFYVLPETARRVGADLDPRPVLLRALVLIGALTAGALAVFAGVPELLLRVAFGEEYEPGADILLTLGIAFALLAATYLAVQYQLGLHRRAFLAVLGSAAIAEPLLLLGATDLESFAVTVLAVQATAAIVLLAISARAVTDARPPAHHGTAARE